LATPIKSHKVSHVILNVADTERSVKFYTEILGFKVSDRNEFGMVFLRNGTDHHTVGFAPAPEGAVFPSAKEYVTLNHMALEVDSIEDLIKAREFLKEQGIPIHFEGRRGAGCNVGIEFKDPDGYSIELTCQMDQIPWDGEARPHDQHRRASSLEEAAANPLPAYDSRAVGAR